MVPTYLECLYHKRVSVRLRTAKSHNFHCINKLILYFSKQRYNNGNPKQIVGTFVRKANVAQNVMRANRHHPSLSIHSEKK